MLTCCKLSECLVLNECLWKSHAVICLKFPPGNLREMCWRWSVDTLWSRCCLPRSCLCRFVSRNLSTVFGWLPLFRYFQCQVCHNPRKHFPCLRLIFSSLVRVLVISDSTSADSWQFWVSGASVISALRCFFLYSFHALLCIARLRTQVIIFYVGHSVVDVSSVQYSWHRIMQYCVFRLCVHSVLCVFDTWTTWVFNELLPSFKLMSTCSRRRRLICALVDAVYNVFYGDYLLVIL